MSAAACTYAFCTPHGCAREGSAISGRSGKRRRASSTYCEVDVGVLRALPARAEDRVVEEDPAADVRQREALLPARLGIGRDVARPFDPQRVEQRTRVDRADRDHPARHERRRLRSRARAAAEEPGCRSRGDDADERGRRAGEDHAEAAAEPASHGPRASAGDRLKPVPPTARPPRERARSTALRPRAPRGRGCRGTTARAAPVAAPRTRSRARGTAKRRPWSRRRSRRSSSPGAASGRSRRERRVLRRARAVRTRRTWPR